MACDALPSRAPCGSETESMTMTDVGIPESLMEAWKRVGGHSCPDVAVDPDVFVVSAEVNRQQEWLEKNHPEPGNLVEGQGISLGIWKPVDTKGKSLGKEFHVYAAPCDLGADEEGLPGAGFYYGGAQAAIAELKKWHGFDGTHYVDEQGIYDALRDGSYNGGWIIPPSVLLVGLDRENRLYKEQDCLSKHHDAGAFHGQFDKGDKTPWYWSSSVSATQPDLVYVGNVKNVTGVASLVPRKWRYMPCRPVRLVEIKPR